MLAGARVKTTTSIELVLAASRTIALTRYGRCNYTNHLQRYKQQLMGERQLTLVFENEEMVVGMIKMRELPSGFECVWALTKLLV